METTVHRFPIVGVGASAGGIDALRKFFASLPVDNGMAFIVATHLRPDRESLLPEVIARFTPMPVERAIDGVELLPNTVYVMPQNVVMTVAQRRARLRPPSAHGRERHPIDVLFASLAQDQEECAVGVVLSGGDADGTLGVKVIKEHGGLTLAQTADDSGPEYPSMPSTAISTGLVDIAIPAGEMGPRLQAYYAEIAGTAVKADATSEATQEAAQEAIYAALRNHTGHDFSGYKDKTFMRRVHRRMLVVQAPSVAAYAEILRRDSTEAASLFRDLLIRVTSFFRDAEAFDALRTLVIPRLFDGKGAADKVRIWVPGCATGEEAYTIAILVREHLDTLSERPQVQIFATDIDATSLSIARLGHYPAAMLDAVPEERLKRFFIKEPHSYTVAKEIRELCIFSPHSVVREPPFSRMDMVSCRNLLIYLGNMMQERVIPTFHYALRPGGFLFLGASESIGRFANLFAVVDKKQRIFQSRGAPKAPGWLPLDLDPMRRMSLPITERDERRSLVEANLRRAIESHVLERIAPPHVVVSADGAVVYFSSQTRGYLEAPAGAPSINLFAMARPALRADLRSALRQASESHEKVRRENIPFEAEQGQMRSVNVSVDPLPDRTGTDPLFLVAFNEGRIVPQASGQERTAATDRDRDRVVADLERELREVQDRQQTLVEEYETALEDLKSSNEELISVNEEFQSTNEELEASREELQSLNEELTAVNLELTEKVDELDRRSADLRNVYESSEVATVFLDPDLHIRSFTPAASNFFRLIPADVGRPITDLSSVISYPELETHIREVLATGKIVETRLRHEGDDKRFLVRLLPYHNSGNSVSGAIITFLDVTSLAHAEEHQHILIDELNHRVRNMLAVVMAVANQTFRRSPSIEVFKTSFLGRMQSMARAYTLLARDHWTSSSLDEMVRQELTPFGIERVAINGEDVRLSPRQSVSIGMAIHELATNAIKHGALSVPAGRVSISWARKTSGDVELVWREAGGPPVLADHPRGFGLELIEQQLRHTLGGEARLNFLPDGLEAILTVKVEAQPGAT